MVAQKARSGADAFANACGMWAGAMARQCSGVTRKGARCSITSTSRLSDERGRLVAEPLQLGGSYCRFHARPFVAQFVDRLDRSALLFFLDLETTGVDVASDQIVELACCHAPSDPRANGAAFSTVVRASAEDTAAHIHGITQSEIAAAPAFSVAWARFLDFVDHLQRFSVQEHSDSECEPEECATLLSAELPTVLTQADCDQVLRQSWLRHEPQAGPAPPHPRLTSRYRLQSP